MAKCSFCEKEEGIYFTNEGKPVCENCAGKMFTCPGCGRIFEDELADMGGFCKKCKDEED